MQIAELFYSVFWVSCICTVWFYTDTVLYYCNLLNLFPKTMEKYTSFIKENPQKYFPDFLYQNFSRSEKKILSFAVKLLNCIFCLGFWLSFAFCAFTNSWLMTAPVYILSLLFTLKIKNLI